MSERNFESFKEELKTAAERDKTYLKHFDPNCSIEYDENGNLVEHPIYKLFDDYFAIRGSDFTIEYFKMIVSAIYLEYRRLFPGLDIIIQFREKGVGSFQKNIDKTLAKPLVTNVDKWEENLCKDILGMKIVIDGLPDELPFDYNEETSEIMTLNEKRLDNALFSNKLKKWMQGHSDELQDEETYYDYKIQLLTRLKECSYDTYTNSANASNPYTQQLIDTIRKKAEKEKDSDGFAFDTTKSQLNELENLRIELIERLNEKLEDAIVDYTLPRILSTELVSKELCVQSQRDSSPKKDNGWIRKSTGYTALYYSLHGSLTDGKSEKIRIECQTNSERTHKIDKKDHNDMSGKRVEIYENVFELTEKNDPHPLKYYIDILDKIPAIAVYSQESEYEKAQKKALSALSHIQLKDFPYDADKENFLLSFAKYASPWLYTTHSAHNKAIPTVLIEKKTLAENVADVLRKRDGLSILAHMVIEKLEQLEMQDKKKSVIYDNTYTRIDIRKFAEKYKNKEKDESKEL